MTALDLTGVTPDTLQESFKVAVGPSGVTDITNRNESSVGMQLGTKLDFSGGPS